MKSEKRNEKLPKLGVQTVSRAQESNCTSFLRIILLLPMAMVLLSACGMMNLGKFKGIEWTAKDEKYYKVKEIVLSSGAMGKPRTEFDHTMQDAVVLTFIPAQEPNKYVSKTVWIDPSNVEFRTIRQTHDVQVEAKEAFDRNPKGTPRAHSISTKELFQHKPGLWTVKLYLDNELVRRLTFSVS
jgi:hypothetical protein